MRLAACRAASLIVGEGKMCGIMVEVLIFITGIHTLITGKMPAAAFARKYQSRRLFEQAL